MKKYLLILSAAFSLSYVKAQDSTETQKAQLKVSVNYNSGLNYYGRIDSLESTGFFPMVELWFSPKFYINAAPVFVNNKAQSFDYAGTVASIGYQYMDEKWLTSIYGLKPFYTDGAGLVQSALKAQTGFSVSRLNNFLNVTLGGDIKFSNNIDFGATAGLDHIFRIQAGDNSVLVIDPSFYVQAGTQQFSRTYNKRRDNGVLLPPTNEQVTEQVKEFNILSYEASVPLVFAKNKWMLIATPSYVIPQNLITVPGRPDLSEYGRNLFYTTLGVKYTF